MSEVTTVYQYKIFCLTENNFVNTWNSVEPTICPNDGSDIDSTKTTVIGKLASNEITVNEPTYGQFQHTTLRYDIPAGTPGDVTLIQKSWPFPIQLWKNEVYCNSNNVGDIINIIIAPNTVVGVLTSTANIGDTVLNVSPTCVSNALITKGIELTLDNTFYSEGLGSVITFNTTTHQITVQNPLTMQFVAGSMVRLNLYQIKDLYMHRPDKIHRISDKGFRSKTLPANIMIHALYQNNDGLAKEVVFTLEYYYL